VAPKGGYEYNLLVDGVAFDEAHAAFLAALSTRAALERVQVSEQRGGDAAVDALKKAQLQDAVYIKRHWSLRSAQEKTAHGFGKSTIRWSFTLRGRPHTIELQYHNATGKRKLLLDDQVVLEEKPSLLSTNKHKRWTHRFKVDNVECEVSTQKNKHRGVVSPQQTPQKQSTDAAAAARPILFGLLIDGVPFDACVQTETDLAGGNVALDKQAERLVKQQAAAQAQAAAGRRHSTHDLLSAAEYEEAMREQHAGQEDSGSDTSDSDS